MRYQATSEVVDYRTVDDMTSKLIDNYADTLFSFDADVSENTFNSVRHSADRIKWFSKSGGLELQNNSKYSDILYSIYLVITNDTIDSIDKMDICRTILKNHFRIFELIEAGLMYKTNCNFASAIGLTKGASIFCRERLDNAVTRYHYLNELQKNDLN